MLSHICLIDASKFRPFLHDAPPLHQLNTFFVVTQSVSHLILLFQSFKNLFVLSALPHAGRHLLHLLMR